MATRLMEPRIKHQYRVNNKEIFISMIQAFETIIINNYLFVNVRI